MMQTDEMRDLVPPYAAGSLPPETAAALTAHLVQCEGCRQELSDWRAIAAAAQHAANAPAPSRGLLDRAFYKIDAVDRPPAWHERWLAPLRRPLVARALAGVATAAALSMLLLVTPVGTLAQQLLEVFQPKQFVVVPVTPADLRALPSLNDYGDFTNMTHGEPKQVPTAAEASAASGIKPLSPGMLPAGVPATPSVYQVMPSSSATFTFSAAKAGATAKAKGKQLPPMPANIDGSSVQLTTGNAVVAVYGEMPSRGSAPKTPEEALAGMPKLLVAQAFAPSASSTGATAKELQQYLLSQPEIPQDLANALRAIGDPTTTWPIPVPASKVQTRSVSVQGSPATVFSDDGGFISGVVWVKSGMVYGVGGPLPERDVLAVADSLR